MGRKLKVVSAILTVAVLSSCSDQGQLSPELYAVLSAAATAEPTAEPTAQPTAEPTVEPGGDLPTTVSSSSPVDDDRVPTFAEHFSSDRYQADLLGRAVTQGMQGEVRDYTAFPLTTPGESLNVIKADTGKHSLCTLGALAERNGQRVLVTAGHCGVEGSVYRDDTSLGDRRIGTTVVSEYRGDPVGPTYTDVSDFSIISTADKGVGYDPRIAGKYSVTGVADSDTIEPGTEICKFGSRTGETCGEVLALTDTYIRAGTYSVGGDSGSPAYVKTGPDTALLVGFLSSSPGDSDYVTDFALADAIFLRYGLTVP